MPFEPHLDRARAESFGSYAEAYDGQRPPFPNSLFDDLVALAPKRVLDAACGTGLVARGLAARGLSVLGVELDARMAFGAFISTSRYTQLPLARLSKPAPRAHRALRQRQLSTRVLAE